MRAIAIKLCAAALAGVVLVNCSEVVAPESPRPEERAHVSLAPSSLVLYDNFDDDALDPELWTTNVEGGFVEVREAGQRLEITFPATTSGSTSTNGVMSRCALLGSFDIQADYQLLTWPAQNGVRLGLGAAARDVVARHSSGVSDGTFGELYHTNFAGTVGGLTPTTDLVGKLRLTRSGSTLTGYYWGGSDWVLLSSGSITLNVEEIPISLLAWTHDSTFGREEVKVAFDNVLVNAGTLSCPEPEVTPVIVDVKPGDDENTINTRSRGAVRVAVLTTRTAAGDVADFDALTVDAASVAFGPGGATAIQSRGDAEDVDADGDLDIVFRFDVVDADLPEDATEACLTGEAAGRPISGCDSVRLVGQPGPGKGKR